MKSYQCAESSGSELGQPNMQTTRKSHSINLLPLSHARRNILGLILLCFVLSVCLNAKALLNIGLCTNTSPIYTGPGAAIYGPYIIAPGQNFDIADVDKGCCGCVYGGLYHPVVSTCGNGYFLIANPYLPPPSWCGYGPQPHIGLDLTFDGCDMCPHNSDDGGDGGGCKESQSCCGAPVWRVTDPNCTLLLDDEPLGYTPATGPRISLHLSFKHREMDSGMLPHEFGLGKRWNFSWHSRIMLLGDINGYGYAAINYPDGRKRNVWGYSGMDYVTNRRMTGNISSGYSIVYPDGSTDFYGLIVTNSTGGFLKSYLSESANAQSQKTKFYYAPYDPSDPVIRLQYVVDADGRTNTIHYVSSNPFSTNLISEVVDAFGRTNSYLYDTNGYLTNITDVAGISTSFMYDEHGWVTNMTTPYGTTSFAIHDNGPDINSRSVLVTQPDGGHQLYLYTNSAPGIASSYSSGEIPQTSPFTNTFDNSGLNLRNSFYWGPRQYANLSTTTISSFTADDFRKARMKHWLNSDTNWAGVTMVGHTLSVEREPSPDPAGTIEGQKTWYDYVGKTNSQYEGTQVLPLYVARVLPDGTTSFTRTDRNAVGNVTTNVSTYSVAGTVLLRTNISTYASDGIDLLTVTNALGVQISSSIYNANHQVLTNYNALGEMTVYTYNASQELTSTLRPTGLITTNIYDGSGLLVSTFDYEIVGGSPVYYRTNSYTYANDLVYTHTDERDLITTNLYDNLQRLTNSSDSRGAIKNIYANLDLVQVIDRMGLTNSYGYDSMRRKIAQTNALGFYTLYSYCNCGSLDSIRDAMGNTNYFFYDNAGRLLATTYADGYSTTNNLNLLAQITNTIDSAGYSVTNWFNNQGLQYAATTAAGNLQYLDFDAIDRTTNSTDSEGVSTSMTYDDLDRLLTRTYPDNGVEKFGYLPRGMIAYTNQIGLSNFFAYDAIGRKTVETNANAEVIRYTNSPAGDLLSLTDGKGQTTRWNYDQYGRVTNKLDQASTEILRYGYDANNRLTNRWSAAKGNTAYSYDSVGNLLTINYPSSSDVSFAYDALNRMTNMVDGIGTTKYSYSPAGQLLSEDGPFASDTVTNGYSNRLRTSLSLQQPAGFWTNGFAYDITKRLTNVTSQAGSFGYLYDPALFTHHASRISLPNTSYITNIFDGNARLLATYLKNSTNGVLDSYVYSYNPANQRTNLARVDTSTVAYKYDPIGQLRVADSSVNAEDYGYSYDSAWNVSFRTNNGTFTTFLVDNKNELTNHFGPNGYDLNGNLTNRESEDTLVYDDENRLTLISGDLFQNFRTAFAYDGLGRLRIRTEYTWSGSAWVADSVVNYIYDGWRVIQERDSGNTPTVSYTHGNDLSGSMEGAGGIGGMLARSDGYSSGNFTTHNFYFADGNGNITYMLNNSQSMVASYRYEPLGNTISSSGTLADANVYRFSSKEIMGNSGLYYFGYRFYDPNLQRWINRDPSEERGGVNLYAFAENDSINAVDDLGQGVIYFANPNGGRGTVIFTAPTDPNQASRVFWQTFWDEGGRDAAIAMIPIPGVGEEVVAAKCAKSCSPQKMKAAISTIKNIIKSFKTGPRGDVSGVVAEMAGLRIPKPMKPGAYWDHIMEWQQKMRGLRNQIETLKNCADPAAAQAIKEAEQFLKTLEDAIKGTGL
jgi:RHS repeat-associated protein